MTSDAVVTPTEDLRAALPGAGRARVHLCGTLLAEIGGRRVEGALPRPQGPPALRLLCRQPSPSAQPRRAHRCHLARRVPCRSRRRVLDAPHAATHRTRPRGLHGRSELWLELGPEPWVDWDVACGGVRVAEARLAGDDAAGALEIAAAGLEVARRPLLPADSTPWLEDRRRELIEARAALLETAGRAALSLGGEHLFSAERHARELIGREPYRESAYGLLMETHAARGNVAEALRVYDDLRRVLREELGMTPAPVLSSLAGRLLEQHGGRGSAHRPPPPRAADDVSPLPPAIAAVAGRPLAGRGAELSRLRDLVRDRSADGCAVIAITGEAGIGKTRLAAAAAAHAHAEGSDVMHGGVHRGGVTPYAPFVEALRQHLTHGDAAARELAPVLGPELAELALLAPELRRTVPAAAAMDGLAAAVRRQRMFDAVGALFAAIASRRPLVLVLEDLQWADAATVLLVCHVARAGRGEQLTILLTIRDDEPPGPDLRTVLHDLLRERLLDRVPLGPMSEPEVAELAAAAGRQGLGPEAVAALRAQAGEPLLRRRVDARQRRRPWTGAA